MVIAIQNTRDDGRRRRRVRGWEKEGEATLVACIGVIAGAFCVRPARCCPRRCGRRHLHRRRWKPTKHAAPSYHSKKWKRRSHNLTFVAFGQKIYLWKIHWKKVYTENTSVVVRAFFCFFSKEKNQLFSFGFPTSLYFFFLFWKKLSAAYAIPRSSNFTMRLHATLFDNELFSRIDVIRFSLLKIWKIHFSLPDFLKIVLNRLRFLWRANAHWSLKKKKKALFIGRDRVIVKSRFVIAPAWIP